MVDDEKNPTLSQTGIVVFPLIWAWGREQEKGKKDTRKRKERRGKRQRGLKKKKKKKKNSEHGNINRLFLWQLKIILHFRVSNPRNHVDPKLFHIMINSPHHINMLNIHNRNWLYVSKMNNSIKNITHQNYWPELIFFHSMKETHQQMVRFIHSFHSILSQSSFRGYPLPPSSKIAIAF